MKHLKIKSMIIVAIITLTLMVMCISGVSAQAGASSKDESGIGASSVFTDSILDKADINLGDYDKVVRVDGKGCVVLTIIRAYDVEINYRGEIFTAKCADCTVKEAIESAGITLTGAEVVEPSLNSKVYPGCKISVSADCGATITVDGKTSTYSITSGTVEAMLGDLGIVLGEDDIITPDLDTVIYDGISITIQRVEYKEETTTEVIDYGFVSEKTSSLVSGTSKIKQNGIEGEKTIVSKNTYIDGVLVETSVISEEVTKEPVDQIKLIGTGRAHSSGSSSGSSSSSSSVSSKAGTFVDHNGNVVSYRKKLVGSSTAYYTEAGSGALTATGVVPYVGGVAVNPNVIPYGSKLYIVSTDGKCVYGYATAVDTGGALMSGYVLVDVYYNTYNECMNWGRRNAIVYVL